ESDMPTAKSEGFDITKPGTTVGTVAYMSPEQVLGEDLDSRTDLFSFGIVLYEMATGNLPFQAVTSGGLANEILNKTPKSLVFQNSDLPKKFEEIVMKALEKNRKLRYQSAADIHADFLRMNQDVSRTSAAPPLESDKSVFVLPFANLSSTPD